MVFNHSVKVPTQYKKAAQIFKKAANDKTFIKNEIYSQSHVRMPNLVALLHKYSQNKNIIENMMIELKILEENPRMNPDLCRVLLTELSFGAKKLNGGSKPVQTILSYQDKINELLGNVSETTNNDKIYKPRYIRINTHKYSITEMLKYLKKLNFIKKDYKEDSYDDYLETIKNLENSEFVIDIHIPELFAFSPKTKSFWADHELTKQKKVYQQDRATCLVGKLLNPPKNSIVLDMCAAPGMKSIHVSNIMENTGLIYAIERDSNRFQTLYTMINQSGGDTSIRPIHGDATALTADDYPNVEYILVDPSCSGSGQQNRISLTTKSDKKDDARLRKLSFVQMKILSRAMSEFPNVKRIVYSTCSIYEEENEQVVQHCLQQFPQFKLLSCKKELHKLWKNTGNNKYEGIGKNCIYALPNEDFTDGIFMAIFERIKQ